MIADCGPDPRGRVNNKQNPRFILVYAMPFGWSKASYCFNKGTRLCLQRCREENIKCSFYADDQAGGHADREVAQQQQQRAEVLLAYFGYKKVVDKGQSIVAQSLMHLGIIAMTDTPAGLWVVPDEKARKLSKLAKAALCAAKRNKMFISGRVISSYIGFLVSLRLPMPQALFQCW